MHLTCERMGGLGANMHTGAWAMEIEMEDLAHKHTVIASNVKASSEFQTGFAKTLVLCPDFLCCLGSPVGSMLSPC